MKDKTNTAKSQLPGAWPGSWLDRKTSKKLAWLELLQMARHDKFTEKLEDNYKWKGKWEYSVIPGKEHEKVKNPFIIKHGSIGIAKTKLAVKWGWSRGKVIRFFEELKTAHRITEVGYDGIGTIITIVDMEKENMPPLWKEK